MKSSASGRVASAGRPDASSKKKATTTDNPDREKEENNEVSYICQVKIYEE